MTIEKHSIPNSTAAIWGETVNLNWFLNEELPADTIGGVETRTKSVPARSVRRYKGDPNPYEIKALTEVRYLYDPGRKNGGATPGQELILVAGAEKRSFTYVGSFVDVHAFLLGAVKYDTTVYSAGAGYELKAVSAGMVTSAKAR